MVVKLPAAQLSLFRGISPHPPTRELAREYGGVLPAVV